VLRSAIYLSLALAISSASLLGLGTVASASASNAAYADWALHGNSGTEAVPASDFPDATFTSDSSPLRVPTGVSAFLNTTTPFGAEFGSSRGRGYLAFGTARSHQPSTTTITFESGTPTGRWGFALGDIDADHARIIATAPDGTTLTASQLGWQGAFNYCEGSPRPPACTRGDSSDKPHWDPATSTLIGNVVDTDGASGWFRPTTSVKELTIVFAVQSGIPVGQLWIAAKWQGKEDIPIKEVIGEPAVPPGDPFPVVITIRDPGPKEPDADVCDDLPRDVSAARYDNDAHDTGGSLSYHDRRLCWDGPLAPGKPEVIGFTETPGSQPGPRELVSAVYGIGPRETCQHGCFATILVLGRNLCRATVSQAAIAPGRPAAKAC